MKKLISILFALYLAQSLFSQIIYVNNPDIVIVKRDSNNNLPNDSLYIDLDSDNKNDILFTIPNGIAVANGITFALTTPGYYLPMIPDTNRVIAYFEPNTDFIYADTVTLKSEICEQHFYDDTVGLLAAYVNGISISYQLREGKFKKNDYLALKFYDSDGEVYYGRIEISVSQRCDSITIHSWNYEATGKCINAAGITEINHDIKLDYRIQQKQLIINDIIGPNKLNLSVLSINGQEILQQSISNNDYVNLSSLNNGLYVIRFSDNKGNYISDKFMILE